MPPECSQCDLLIRGFADAAERLSITGEALARYKPVLNEAQVKQQWADCESARKAFQAAREQLVAYVARHHK